MSTSERMFLTQTASYCASLLIGSSLELTQYSVPHAISIPNALPNSLLAGSHCLCFFSLLLFPFQLTMWAPHSLCRRNRERDSASFSPESGGGGLTSGGHPRLGGESFPEGRWVDIYRTATLSVATASYSLFPKNWVRCSSLYLQPGPQSDWKNYVLVPSCVLLSPFHPVDTGAGIDSPRNTEGGTDILEILFPAAPPFQSHSLSPHPSWGSMLGYAVLQR